jgi:DNA-binding IclR family transcriptional regulator
MSFARLLQHSTDLHGHGGNHRKCAQAESAGICGLVVGFRPPLALVLIDHFAVKPVDCLSFAEDEVSAPDKLLAVFALFTIEEPEWTVDDAAERLGIAVSTAYRFFKRLSDAGLISTFSTGRYVLGPAIVQLDRQTRLLDPLMQVAQPAMKMSVSDVEVPGVMLLCRLFRKQVMCIHQEFTQSPSSTISYERGRPLPLYRGAASKVILAHLPARTVHAFYDENKASMMQAGFSETWDGVKSTLRSIRTAKTCITVGELDEGITGVAVALRNELGNVDASLGFALPNEFVSADYIETVSKKLTSAAAEIEGGLLKMAGARLQH